MVSRFPGQDREGRTRTVILWRESDLIDGRVVHQVVLTVDSTEKTVTLLSCTQAIEIAQALLGAAQWSPLSPRLATGRAAPYLPVASRFQFLILRRRSRRWLRCSLTWWS
ncbi:MAG: hypothetical protein ACRDSZ_02910 [Pseudonocardiaceae bacterium]